MRRLAFTLTSTIALSAVAAPAHADTAVLAGGCFWGMEAVFEHVKGVRKVVAGYAGGTAVDANYAAVSSERTGHAEAVRISFDPAQVSYAQLLQIYFTIAHDPTELDRQGPDVGRSYRSAVFPQLASQRLQAAGDIARLRRAVRGGRVVTTIETGSFFPAEEAHQQFVRRHPGFPYVVVNDLPKLARLKASYPRLWTD